MKTKFLIGLTTLALIAPALTRAGADGSGGGDTELSAPDQVARAVYDAAYQLPFLFTYYSFPTPDDARAQAMIEKIWAQFGGYDAFGRRMSDQHLSDALQGPLHIINAAAYSLTQEPCKDDGNSEHFGGAMIGDTHTPFCLSQSELQKLPPSSLVDQLIPLMAHELAHQASYGEEDARYFQSKILERTRNSKARRFLQQLAFAADRSISGLLQHIQQHRSSSGMLCAQIGELQANLDSLNASWPLLVNDGSIGMSEADREVWGRAAHLTRQLSTFCGLSPKTTEPSLGFVYVKKGDLDGLKQTLKDYAPQVRFIADHLRVY